MKRFIECPHCHSRLELYKNPIPTVDIIIDVEGRIVLIKRKNPPFGWALPGGFVDYGETLEHTAIREAKEETGLDIHHLKLLGVYSSPERDPRCHTVTTVFIANASGIPVANDDAEEALLFQLKDIPEKLAFDHKQILTDYIRYAGTVPNGS